MAKVLVVEDHEDNRRLVVTRIERAGHRVVACADAESALEEVDQRGAPDVAVLDVSLPGMDGLELCTALRDTLNNPDLPVIFLTARVNPDDVAKGRALGAAYLTKPIITSALLSAIEDSSPHAW